MQCRTGFKHLYAAGGKANAGCRAARLRGSAALATGLCIVVLHLNPSEISKLKDLVDFLHRYAFISSPPSSHTDKMQTLLPDVLPDKQAIQSITDLIPPLFSLIFAQMLCNNLVSSHLIQAGHSWAIT